MKRLYKLLPLFTASLAFTPSSFADKNQQEETQEVIALEILNNTTQTSLKIDEQINNEEVNENIQPSEIKNEVVEITTTPILEIKPILATEPDLLNNQTISLEEELNTIQDKNKELEDEFEYEEDLENNKSIFEIMEKNKEEQKQMKEELILLNEQEEIEENKEIIIEEKEVEEVQKYHNTESYYYVKEDTQLYDTDQDGKQVIKTFKKGEYIKCIAKDVINNEYAIVKIGEQKGFIDAELLSTQVVFKEENTGIYFKEQTMIYELPDEKSAIISVASVNNSIKMIGISNDWIRVQFNDGTVAYVKDKDKVDYISNFNQQSSQVEYNVNALTGKDYNNQEIIENSALGQEIINYATQFVGNKYVWGGTSLTNGCDCSGFVQSVYKNFGIYLNRTSYDQAKNGISVSEEDARPGDLVIYDGHVALYMSPNQIVHASSPTRGIIIGPMHYGKPVQDIRRIVY